MQEDTSSTPEIVAHHWITACKDGRIQDLEAMARGGPWPDLAVYMPFDSALMAAAWTGQTQVCRRLIQDGADLARTDDDGNTPLHWAARRGHFETADLLLSKGAVTEALCKSGFTPMMRAVGSGHIEIMDLLWRSGSTDLHTTSKEGLTSINLALDRDDFSALQWLLDHGAHPDHTSTSHLSTNLTPLWNLIFDNKLIGARMLLEAGADPNFIDPMGNRLLHFAVQEGSSDAIILLLDYGADLSLTNKHGQTPAQVATENNWREFDRVLAEWEARQIAKQTGPATLNERRGPRL